MWQSSGCFFDDGRVRAMVKDNAGTSRTSLPVRLIVSCAEIRYQVSQPGRHRTGNRVGAQLREQALRQGVHKGQPI